MPDIIYEKKDRIAYITLNRPEALNAFNTQMFQEFGEAQVKFKNDADAWVAIISASGGRAFSVGADVKELARKFDARKASLRPPKPYTEDQIATSKPVIGAVDGWCLAGGLEIVIAYCDISIATEKSKFGVPEPKVGRNDAAGPFRLPERVPLTIALEMLLTGDPIDARRAYEVGLINQVVATSEELMPAAEKMAARILACAPLVVRLNKEQVFRLYNQPIPAQISMKDLGEEINLSEDAEEGAKAFAEKRKPVWKGK